MTKKQLDDYNLILNIHTIKIITNSEPEYCFYKDDDIIRDSMFINNNRVFTRSYSIINHMSGEKKYSSILNLNNFNDEIFSISQFYEILNYITFKANISNFCFSRIDFKLDSYIDNYIKYFKLNYLLILLFASRFSVRNNSPIISALSTEPYPHSVFINNNYMEIEYYNKKLESNNQNISKARLEFRCKNVRNKNPIDLANLWKKRLKRINNNYYDLFLDKCNLELQTKYKKLKETCDISFLDFIRINSINIFSRKQLEQLCYNCGIQNPKSRAKNLIITCGIELISESVLNTYIDKIIDSIDKFLI